MNRISQGVRKVRTKQILEAIHQELTNIHYHLDRLELFYKIVNKINEHKERVWVDSTKEALRDRKKTPP